MNITNKFAQSLENASTFTPHITEKGIREYSRQELLADGILKELVDNGIAAALPGEVARVCVALAASDDANYAYLAVADWGKGMSAAVLHEAMNFGSETGSENRLNEHGLGLDNAMSCIDEDNGSWIIYTHEPGKTGYNVVLGPLGQDMEIGALPEIELPRGITFPEGSQWGNPSTVIICHISLNLLRTLKSKTESRMKNLKAFEDLIYEHLGVAYRPYLRYSNETGRALASIALTLCGKTTFVAPIEIPMKDVLEEVFEVELNGEIVPIRYRHGSLNRDKQRDLLPNHALPKHNYRFSQDTEGVDIQCGNRVIATHQFSEIWLGEDDGPIRRHPSYNHFVGEVIIPDVAPGALPTLLNKTGIHYRNAGWQAIVEELRQFPPIPRERSDEEEAIKDKFELMLKNDDLGNIVTREKCVFDDGVQIDLMVENERSKQCVVYEVKKGTAHPLDVYQLLMYVHGLLREGKYATKAVLVAKKFPKNIKTQIKFINSLNLVTDPFGRPCKFAIATLQEKGLSAEK